MTVTIHRRTALGLIAAAVAAPGLAEAKTVRVGGRPVWIPDGWSIDQEGAELQASSPDDTTYLIATERAVPVTGLSSVNAIDFVVDDLENVQVTEDRTHRVGREEVRTVKGTGTDEGALQVFWLRLAGGSSKIVTVLVYLPANGVQTVSNGTIERILDSISA